MAEAPSNKWLRDRALEYSRQYIADLDYNDRSKSPSVFNEAHALLTACAALLNRSITELLMVITDDPLSLLAHEILTREVRMALRAEVKAEEASRN